LPSRVVALSQVQRLRIDVTRHDTSPVTPAR